MALEVEAVVRSWRADVQAGNGGRCGIGVQYNTACGLLKKPGLSQKTSSVEPSEPVRVSGTHRAVAVKMVHPKAQASQIA
jgi:hypothetical protein